MFERFTDKARKVVVAARGQAIEQGDDQIRPVHMLYGLAVTDGVADTFGTYNKPVGPSRNTAYAAPAVRPTAAAPAPCGLDGLGHSRSPGARGSVRVPAGHSGCIGLDRGRPPQSCSLDARSTW